MPHKFTMDDYFAQMEAIRERFRPQLGGFPPPALGQFGLLAPPNPLLDALLAHIQRRKAPGLTLPSLPAPGIPRTLKALGTGPKLPEIGV